MDSPETRATLASTRVLALALRDVILNGGAFQQVRAARLGLGPTDLIALGHVYLAGSLTPSELANRLGLTTGSITPLVDRVQAAGFLVREINPHDRRSVLVRTTAAGDKTMKQFYDQLDTVVRDAFEDPPRGEANAINEIFQKAGQALKAHSAI